MKTYQPITPEIIDKLKAITGPSYVKTDRDIPIGLIHEAMKLLDGVEVTSPVHVGDVVVPDICGTGAAWVASRDM